jgi:hypothetical protein
MAGMPNVSPVVGRTSKLFLRRVSKHIAHIVRAAPTNMSLTFRVGFPNIMSPMASVVIFVVYFHIIYDESLCKLELSLFDGLVLLPIHVSSRCLACASDPLYMPMRNVTDQ